MNYSEKVQESVEFADLRNKVQSLLDYIGSEDEQLKNDREWTMKSNESIAYQMINNNIKQNYIIESTLLAIRNDIELMHDDIQANIKQEKKALSQAGKPASRMITPKKEMFKKFFILLIIAKITVCFYKNNKRGI